MLFKIFSLRFAIFKPGGKPPEAGPHFISFAVLCYRADDLFRFHDRKDHGDIFSEVGPVFIRIKGHDLVGDLRVGGEPVTLGYQVPDLSGEVRNAVSGLFFLSLAFASLRRSAGRF